jgi:hypothetical protein
LKWCCNHDLVLKTENKANSSSFYEIKLKAVSFVEWLERLKD